MPIYTCQGDSGTTLLFGGVRVGKDDPSIEVCGAIDELSATLGVVRTHDDGLPTELANFLFQIQQELIDFCAEIVSDTNKVSPEHIRRLEKEIDRIELELPPLKQFIIPGENKISVQLHLSRTVCRRAERSLTVLLRRKDKSPHLAAYLNRLGDLLFVMARLTSSFEADKQRQKTEPK
jgi:cob(I)alamin adenosyltransferase